MFSIINVTVAFTIPDLDLLLCIIHSRQRVYTYLCLAYLLTGAEWHPGFEDNYGMLDDRIVDDLLRFVCRMISLSQAAGEGSLQLGLKSSTPALPLLCSPADEKPGMATEVVQY